MGNVLLRPRFRILNVFQKHLRLTSFLPIIAKDDNYLINLTKLPVLDPNNWYILHSFTILDYRGSCRVQLIGKTMVNKKGFVPKMDLIFKFRTDENDTNISKSYFDYGTFWFLQEELINR